VLTGHRFFPLLISAPFHHGLVIVFSAAIAMSVLGALISLMRGKQFYYQDAPAAGGPALATAGAGAPLTAGSPLTAEASKPSARNGRPAGNGKVTAHPEAAGGTSGQAPAPSSVTD
jgi:hypothetical protein